MNIYYALAMAALSLLSSCDNIDSSTSTEEKLTHAKYTCDNGKPLSITYTNSRQHNLSAIVTFNGSTYNLARTRSASGEKYSDGINTWWSKAEVGFLEIDKVIVLKNCSLEEPIKQMHPSWDKNKDSINDCESDGSCDHTIDYSKPRTI